MRVAYYGYCLEYTDGDSTKRCLFNIKDILETLITKELPGFKSDFIYGDENLYLVKESPSKAPDTYFFLITRDSELVKTINSSDISVQDIREIIKGDEKLGIGSFIHAAHDSCLAYVGQLMSPRIDIFWYYIKTYLDKIISPNPFKVISKPLLAGETIERVMNMDRITKTTMEIGAEHTFSKAFSRLIGNNNGEDEIESIQITINPKRGRNTKDFIQNLPQYIDENLRKLVIKAQGDVYSSITDLYIIGSGGLCDSINPDERDSNSVSNCIEGKMKDNKALSQKLNEYKKLDVYEPIVPSLFFDTLKGRGRDVGQ
jgi:hypothetical protein